MKITLTRGDCSVTLQADGGGVETTSAVKNVLEVAHEQINRLEAERPHSAKPPAQNGIKQPGRLAPQNFVGLAKR